MKRKKTAASLIIVVIIFMFISTVSIAMLSMISADYKARVIESKRIENLYGSESGLDIAYNIIGKTFEAAAKYGKLKVEKMQGLTKNSVDDGTSPYNEDYIDLKKDINYWKEYNNNQEKEEDKKSQKYIDEKIDKDNEILNIIINEEFKRSFNNFIVANNYTNKESAPSKLRESITDEKPSYVNKVKDLNNNDSSYEIAEIQFPNSSNMPNLSINNSDGIKYNKGSLGETKSISLESSNKQTSIDVYNNEKYTITVQSEFESNDGNDAIGSNKRIIQVNYTMSVPNYEEIYFTKSSGNLENYMALENRALIIGKDMRVGNEETSYKTNLTVNKGDIFVGGKEESIIEDNRIFGKYLGGITLNNSMAIFNGDVITRGTFDIENNVGFSENEPSIINGNLYAKNVYAGSSTNKDEITHDSYLKAVSNVVIDNDLSVKASNTQIEIENFYGINDKNTDEDGNEISSDMQTKARTSSSIIVNDYTNTTGRDLYSVKINKLAYIMGTAHIATDGNYQTGESAAVKGNYEAYSVPLDELEKFKYDNPLQVLDDSNVFNKSKHFYDYWENIKGIDNVSNGGISLPDSTKSIGAIVYKNDNTNSLIDSTYDPSLESKYDGTITKKRIEYASKVYKFGQESQTDEAKEKMLTTYNSLGDDEIEVDDLMPFYQISDDYDLDNEINNKVEKAIINNSADITLIIQGKDVDVSKDYYDSEGNKVTNKKVIKVDDKDNLYGVIATAGDVIIDGRVNFNGTIISKGEVTITGDVIINYDEEVIKRIQSNNSELFNGIFGTVTNEYDEEETENNNEILIPNFDINKFLNIKLWKLVK